MKECSVCDIPYTPRNGSKTCSKECAHERRKAQSSIHYYENKGAELERRKQYVKEWRLKHPGKTYMKCTTSLWNGAKDRCKKSGIEFSITPLDIVVPVICPILGVVMERPGRYAPSLDRKDPSKGYTPDNIWVISKLANRMKNDATEEELGLFAQWLLKR